MPTNLMEKLEAAPARPYPLNDVRTHEALTPRKQCLIPLRDWAQQQRQSDDHTYALSSKLKASEEVELDPVVLVSCEGSDRHGVPAGVYLLDGNHRLAAYRRAGRSFIPARLCELSYEAAVLASKLVNCSNRALGMHQSQRRDAAWQYIALVTLKGAIPLPASNSYRSISARFGISKNTVMSMMKALPAVDLANHSDRDLDPGTGWPMWRYVCQSKNPWRTALASMSEEEQAKSRAVRLALDLIELRNNHSPFERVLAFQILLEEGQIAQREPGDRAIDVLMELGRSDGLDLEFLSQLGQPIPSPVPEQSRYGDSPLEEAGQKLIGNCEGATWQTNAPAPPCPFDSHAIHTAWSYPDQL